MKRPERIADYSRSVPEFKNEWSCTSSPVICLRDVDRDKFMLQNFFSKVRTDFMCNLRCMSAFELLNWNRVANLIVNYAHLKLTNFFRFRIPVVFFM
jgi:hypothetical protein